MSAAPLERELLVEGATVRDPGEGVGRRLRGDAAEVAEHPQERAGEHQRDEHEQRERAQSRVADSMPVGSDARLDRVLRPQRQQPDAARVGDARGQRAVPLAFEADRAPAGRQSERLVPTRRPRRTSARRSPRACGASRVRRALSRWSSGLTATTLPIRRPSTVSHTERSRTFFAGAAPRRCLFRKKETPGSRAAIRVSAAGRPAMNALHVLRAGEIGRSGRSLVGEPVQLAQAALELCSKGRICMGPLVAKRVVLQDADGRGDRDRADDEHAEEELDPGAARDGWLGAARPPGGFTARGSAGG